MSNEYLIEMITKEVMKKLKHSIEQKSVSNKKVLVLENKENMCSIVKSKLEEDGLEVHFIEDLECIDCYDFMLIQNLSTNELVNISKGYGNSIKENIIIDTILKGKKIYALEKGLEYKKYENTAPKAFIEVFNKYKNTLKTFGIRFISLENFLDNINGKDNKKSKENIFQKQEPYEEVQDKNEKSKNVLSKKLISELDLKRIQKKGYKEIIVNKKSIVTPLAKDFARINNIIIEIEK